MSERRISGVTRRRVLQGLGGSALLTASTAGYASGVEPMLLQVTRYRVRPLAPWPAGLRLRIAALADLHACEPWMSAARIEGIVARTNALDPDLTVLLGDYVAGQRFATRHLDAVEWAPPLGALRARLGVYAVLGNHDWWEDRAAQARGAGPTIAGEALARVGLHVLENDAVSLTHQGRTVWLAGLADQLAFLPSRRRLGRARVGLDDLPATLSKVPDDAPLILLAHEPDIFPRVPARVTLTLSGHTHGGQVRLFGRSPVVPSQYGNRYAYGHVREQGDLIVSGGLGCSIVPVRLGVLPEIVLIELGDVEGERA